MGASQGENSILFYVKGKEVKRVKIPGHMGGEVSVAEKRGQGSETLEETPHTFEEQICLRKRTKLRATDRG